MHQNQRTIPLIIFVLKNHIEKGDENKTTVPQRIEGRIYRLFRLR